MTDQEYEKTALNTVKRHGKQGKYDHETIHSLIDSVPVLHVSFTAAENEDGIAFPTTLPMIGCMAPPPRDTSSTPSSIYIHGHISARLIKAGGALDSSGLPVCISATHYDGLVLALTPFNHSCNFRSAVVFGLARLLVDDVERIEAMRLITDNMLPYRWDNSRVPPTKAELTGTGILKVEIVGASAKTRVGGPGADRKDLRDESVVGRVWTGVLPARVVYGEPVPAETNQVREVPGYIEEFREKINGEGERYSREAASS